MDFTGSLATEYNGLPEYWYLWLIATAIVSFLVQVGMHRVCAISTRGGEVAKVEKVEMIISRSLLASYLVFILMETIIGRTPGERAAELVPFWSYGIPELRMEIILNYILFIPLGFLLYLSFGRKLGMRVVLIGFALSCMVELIQLLLCIGLFEFDDIIGNTIGTAAGAVGSLVVKKKRCRRKVEQ